MPNPYIIIGGDGAGMSAASQARRREPGCEVVVLERGHEIRVMFFLFGRHDLWWLVFLTRRAPS